MVKVIQRGAGIEMGSTYLGRMRLQTGNLSCNTRGRAESGPQSNISHQCSKSNDCWNSLSNLLDSLGQTHFATFAEG